MMVRCARSLVICLIAAAAILLGQRPGQAQEMRFALVIGNDQYRTGALATPANDAGLVAVRLDEPMEVLDPPEFAEAARMIAARLAAAA